MSTMTTQDRRLMSVGAIAARGIRPDDVIRLDVYKVYSPKGPERAHWLTGTHPRWASVYDVDNLDTADDATGRAARECLNPNWVLLRVTADRPDGDQGEDEFVAVEQFTLMDIQFPGGGLTSEEPS